MLLTFLNLAEDRFYVNHWGTIDGLNGTDSHTIFLHFEHSDTMEPDGVRPVGRPCCKYPGEWPLRIRPRMHLHYVAASTV